MIRDVQQRYVCSTKKETLKSIHYKDRRDGIYRERERLQTLSREKVCAYFVCAKCVWGGGGESE